MAIKAIIFDCFGVLVLSGKETLKHDFPDHATELHDLSLRSDYGYISRQQYSTKITEMTGLSSEEFESRYWEKNVRNESVFEWIVAIRKTGLYKVGLLSNIGKGWLDDFLPQSERTKLFDVEVLSGVVGITKPDARIFSLAGDMLGYNVSECIMIDDLLENTEGASKAGMHSVLFGSVADAKIDLERIITDNA